MDLNHRPPGYEPGMLPLHYPASDPFVNATDVTGFVMAANYDDTLRNSQSYYENYFV